MDQDHPQSRLKVWTRRARQILVAGLRLARAVLRLAAAALAAGWRTARPALVAAANILLALIILFEEWGWKPLSDAIAWVARFAPIAALERWIAGLPPYPALLAFAIPATVLLPFKVLALYLLAAGHALSAALVFITAKIAGTAFLARAFTLTKPALMQIGWFKSAYDKFVPWKDALYERIRASWAWRYGRMLKTRLRLRAGQLWARLAPRAVRWLEASHGFGRLCARFPGLKVGFDRLALRVATTQLRGAGRDPRTPS